MKHFLFFIAIALFIGCQEEKTSFNINGSAAGFEDGTNILVYQINAADNQPELIDTLVINNGKFKGTYDFSDEPSINYMAIGKRGNVAYFPENQDLNAVIYKDSIIASYIDGSPQNDGYRKFTQKMRAFAEKKQENAQRYRTAQTQQDNLLASEIQKENIALSNEERVYKKQFIADNPNSLFSVMLLTEMLNRKEITAKETRESIAMLSPKMQNSKNAVTLNNTIQNMSAAEIGSQAPNFSAATPDGGTMSLKDAMGKYTIIDFWASWCKPCRRENPNVVNVYNKYHDKGLNIISVSLDKAGQENRWIDAIANDKMDWYHVSNLKAWQDPIARMYNVRSIPATFLLDENGVIIDKDLRGPALGAKMASLLD